MQAWDQFLEKLEEELGRETVEKWVRSLKIIRFDAGNLYLAARDSFQVSWFEEHIRPRLQGKFFNNNQRTIRVHLSLPNTREGSAKREGSSSMSFAPDTLDPEMTFENFLVPGLASQVLSDGQFNPIFLYGPQGSGKTHLLMAAAAEFQKKGRKVFFIRAETFTGHVVQAIRLGFMQEFRKVYREIDALFIDDIHILAKKHATQEEFFHTFNTLHTKEKQIVLSANAPPSRLGEIEARLISRFEWGISIGLEKGDPRAILEKKAALWKFPLSEELTAFLLERFPSRSLYALQALLLRSKGKVTPQLAELLLKDLLAEEESRALTPEKIIQAVAAHYAIRFDDLLGESQMREYAHPRKVAMFLCRERLKLPYQKIGALFHRDHSTVMTSVRLIQKGVDEKRQDLLEALRDCERIK